MTPYNVHTNNKLPSEPDVIQLKCPCTMPLFYMPFWGANYDQYTSQMQILKTDFTIHMYKHIIGANISSTFIQS